MNSRPNDRLAAWAPWAVPEPDPSTRPAAAAGYVAAAPSPGSHVPTADPHLAGIFRTMRAVLGINEVELARRLGTDVSVIMDLEAGVIDFLPPWHETERLVQRYGMLAGVDVTAVLDAMARLIAAIERERRPPPQTIYQPVIAAPLPVAPPVAPAPRPATEPATSKPRTRPTSKRAAEPTAAVSLPSQLPRPALGAALARTSTLAKVLRGALIAAVLAAGYGVLIWVPQPLYASARALPAPLDRPVRGLADTLVWLTAPTRDGLRWIEMADPRTRKGDRLDVQPPPRR